MKHYYAKERKQEKGKGKQNRIISQV